MKNKKGFTLIEIMFVVGIIGAVSSIAIPNLQRTRQEANETKVIAELNSLSKAIMQYYLIENKYPESWEDLQGYINIDYYKKYYEFGE